MSCSASSARQAGWVKSPVPTRPIPFRRAQKSRAAGTQSGLVAREYLEWICRSAINISPLFRRKTRFFRVFALYWYHHSTFSPPAQGLAFLSPPFYNKISVYSTQAGGIIHESIRFIFFPSRPRRQMAQRILEGMNAVPGVETSLPLDAIDADFVKESACVVLGTPSYLACMAGAVKTWLDTESGKYALAGKLSGLRHRRLCPRRRRYGGAGHPHPLHGPGHAGLLGGRLLGQALYPPGSCGRQRRSGQIRAHLPGPTASAWPARRWSSSGRDSARKNRTACRICSTCCPVSLSDLYRGSGSASSWSSL